MATLGASVEELGASVAQGNEVLLAALNESRAERQALTESRREADALRGATETLKQQLQESETKRAAAESELQELRAVVPNSCDGAPGGAAGQSASLSGAVRGSRLLP